MGRKRKPTVDEVRSLREQLEEYIFHGVTEFEELTGLAVTGVDIRRERKAGFGETEKMIVDVNTKI